MFGFGSGVCAAAALLCRLVSAVEEDGNDFVAVTNRSVRLCPVVVWKSSGKSGNKPKSY